MLIESRPALDPELAALVTAQQREMGKLGGAPITPDDGSSYLVAAIDGRAVACAAWRPAGAGIAEVRRIYVRPSYRGRGIARQLVVWVEEEALAAGHPVIRLDTDPLLEAAIGLCLSSGYQPLPAYAEHAGSAGRVRFEKRLVALVQ